MKLYFIYGRLHLEYYTDTSVLCAVRVPQINAKEQNCLYSVFNTTVPYDNIYLDAETHLCEEVYLHH